MKRDENLPPLDILMNDHRNQTRNRGIWLDPQKVRDYARKKGVGSEAQLETLFRRRHTVPETQGVTVIEKAWKGNKPVDKPQAQRLAECLGLPDWFPLERREPHSSPWKDLITEKRFSVPFMRFIPEDADDERLFSISSDEEEGEALPHHPLDIRWHLAFRGSREQELFILLRSKDRFFQVAPIEGERFPNRFTGHTLRYPSKGGGLEFTEADGTGWRQFIAIRANRIPTMPRNDVTGYECTLDDLELLARRLMDREKPEDIAVETYEFMLTDSGPSPKSG